MTASNTDTGDTTNYMTSNSSSTATSLDAFAAAADDTAAAPPPPREALITTAVNFLQNAKVRHTTLMQKQQFLRSKGLTMQEIQLACERAGSFTESPTKSTIVNMRSAGGGTQMIPRLQSRQTPSFLGRLKEILHSMVLVGGVAYAIYMFFKQFIEPFLFGRKKKPIAESLLDIEKKVETRIDIVDQELARIKDTVVQQTQDQTQQINREFNQFRSDLEAIKGLLLNRKQFAAPLSGVPASIPAWQLASSPHQHHNSQSDDNEKADDADGSGSGSSETEVVTKNSDSSLEIM